MQSHPTNPNSIFYVGQRLTNFNSVDMQVERVARGGYGEVAMGPDQGIAGQWSALKVLRPDLVASLNRASGGAAQQAQQERAARLRAGFLREALTWCGLWPHPNVLTALFVAEINGQLMLVLEYADQGSLRDLFLQAQRQGSWLAPTTALRLAQQIAAGLVELHTPRPDLLRDGPIVHRDLKPENILLSHGRALITDFGLAKAVQEAATSHATTLHNSDDPAVAKTLLGLLTSTGSTTMISAAVANNALATAALPGEPASANGGTATQAYRTQQGVAMGTPAYMAPEQWLDAAAADCPADAYAFGVLLVELFTSQHPLLSLTRPHSLDDWRLAHLADAPRTLTQLGFGAEWQMAAQQQGQEWTPAQAQAAAQATTELDQLCAALLAKTPAARPTLTEALARLQAVAASLGQPPYAPPDVFSPTVGFRMAFWARWASAYTNFGLQEEALRRIERARQLAPDDPDVICLQANILERLGRHEEAVTLHRQALARRATTDIQGRSIDLNQLANVLSDTGRYAEAEDAYAEKLALTPNDAVGWYNRADNERLWALTELKADRRAEARAHAERGLKYAERALALNPENPRRNTMVQRLRQMVAQLQGD